MGSDGEGLRLLLLGGNMRASTPTLWLTDYDLHLFGEGTHLRAYEKLGAHPGEMDGRRGVHFAVWAPNAARVSVVGDHNGWDPRSHPMQPRAEAGLWETFIPDIGTGTLYKYHIVSRENGYEVDKADPYGYAAEVRPQTASRVWDLTAYSWGDQEWMGSRAKKNSLDSPISIYEVHLASWRRGARGGKPTARYPGMWGGIGGA